MILSAKGNQKNLLSIILAGANLGIYIFSIEMSFIDLFFVLYCQNTRKPSRFFEMAKTRHTNL